ncbi:MAG TPA: L-threonylcarbamoyladenylate synthase [Polyangiaceae bacterium]|nr:L-threonylcarbamoyladenylate synthase [Polyangiaceae bacterium]
MPPTERIAVDPGRPDPAALARAAAVLARGGLVAFPTETVYGLGALALDADAVRRIFAAKGRPPSNPVIVHVPGLAPARALAAPFPPLAEALADAFWPGPLTLVVPRSPRVPDVVTAGGPTVALRSPAHPVALGLLEALSAPVAAPSANPSSAVSPTSADHVLAGLDGRIDLVLDAGPCPLGIESTVVDATGDEPLVLRPGSITRDALAAVARARAPAPLAARAPSPPPSPGAAPSPGAVAPPGGGLAGEGPSAAPARSPGQLARHYAPRTPLSLKTRRELIEALQRPPTPPPALLWCGRAPGPAPAGALWVELPNEPAGYAARLYATLHELDGRAGALWVERPPEGPAWEALHDRLRRASVSAG